MFDGRFAVVEAKTVADRHLKLRVRVPSGPIVDAIVFPSFRCARAAGRAGRRQRAARLPDGHRQYAVRARSSS
jgi:hypothetical protein